MMMERRFIFSAALFILLGTHDVFGQKTQMQIARNSVGKLHAAIAGKRDQKAQLDILGEGIKASELAEKDKKTRKWPETWAIKSYLSSYISILDPNEVNSNKYYDLAVQAIDSAKQFDKFEDNSGLIAASAYNINIKKQIRGNAAFNAKDYATAFTYLKQVSDFFPKDTTLALNTALSAQGIKNDDEALAYYKRSKENGIRNPVVFQRMAAIYGAKLDNAQAIHTIEEGLRLNPYSSLLNNDYINLLLDNGKYAEARQVLENTLKVETRSKLLYFLYGYLHQQNANLGTAELAYNKSLALDQNYFDALYQLGLVYVNLGNDALAGNTKDVEKFSSSLNRAEVIFLQAHSVKPKDKPTLNLLVEIYTRKNRFDKVQEFKAQLEEF
jgi:tetratricopeptide (TPR) repeat protein